jgi:hypothetical protein
MKKVIVGNTSQLITKRDGLHTHKWMVYVRGTKEDPDVSKFIKKVRFFLHPSFKPGDVVEISQPPFHLTRKGWGECPVRVQLHFWDARNKPINVVHRLHLEKHMSALQTLGEEQIVDVELDRAFYESSLSGRNSDAESGTQQPANEGAPSLVNGNHGDGRQPVDVNMPGLSMVKSEMDLREVCDNTSSRCQLFFSFFFHCAHTHRFWFRAPTNKTTMMKRMTIVSPRKTMSQGQSAQHQRRTKF